MTPSLSLKQFNTLPTDLCRKIFKDYFYPQVVRELSQYHHSQGFKAVLTEMIEECFNGREGSSDEYLVNHDGVFVRPEPGWFGNNIRYFIRMDPEDSSRLQAYSPDFFFEIFPTPGTWQMLDAIRRRGTRNIIEYEAFIQAKKYYEVYVTTRGSLMDQPLIASRISTFERNDSKQVCQNEEYDYIQLPKDWFEHFKDWK